MAIWKNKHTNQQLIDFLKLSIQYYPNSASLHLLLAEAYKESNQQSYANEYLQKSKKLVLKFPPKNYSWFAKKINDF